MTGGVRPTPAQARAAPESENRSRLPAKRPWNRWSSRPALLLLCSARTSPAVKRQSQPRAVRSTLRTWGGGDEKSERQERERERARESESESERRRRGGGWGQPLTTLMCAHGRTYVFLAGCLRAYSQRLRVGKMRGGGG